jgi:hypothetical protein
MLLLLDTAGMARIAFARETTEHGDRRAYYTAAAPARAVVVFRNGLNADSLIHEVVEANFTTAPAPAGIARAGNEGKPHTIISVLRRVDRMADHVLWRVIEEGRQDSDG